MFKQGVLPGETPIRSKLVGKFEQAEKTWCRVLDEPVVTIMNPRSKKAGSSRRYINQHGFESLVVLDLSKYFDRLDQELIYKELMPK
jgi:hypothetical protein